MFTNALINESSPYLLQHAHNPVNWLPWGDVALRKAREEDKIILVSIGYAACHWCHVMERESFEDEATAAIMNEHFINIKIDREERPDIDHIYMDAVQAMTGSGGWPLNVFLTPVAKPFYGGTYFPPVRAFNRSSWREVLHGVATAWKQRRSEVEQQAEGLTEHLAASNIFDNLVKKQEGSGFAKEQVHTIAENILKTADTVWGGFGQAPKFPQTLTLQCLLQYHHYTGDGAALQQVVLSLDKMLQGGLYDQAGGGFARYSTDNEWLAPHFEKMLYDNALLLNLLANVYAVTKHRRYAKAMHHTIAFLQREMQCPDGGFYAALDADSEGVEGKFYVWSKTEAEILLEPDAALFCDFFDVSEHGNWEEQNILRILQPLPEFCQSRGLDADAVAKKMDNCLLTLLEARANRPRPLTDDKILLGWNALLVTALCRVGAVLQHEPYLQLAEDTFKFLWQQFSTAGKPPMLHTSKGGQAKYPAFADDYAYMIQAAIALAAAVANSDYLLRARELTEYMQAYFVDETGFFYFTHREQTDVIVRKKEVYDGATPSANSTMVHNLVYLGIIFDHAPWRQQAVDMLVTLQPAITRHPGSFGGWAAALLQQAAGTNEVAIVGNQYREFSSQLLANYLPDVILQAENSEKKEFALLNGKQNGQETLLYCCREYSCQAPVDTVAALLALLSQTGKM